MFLEIGAFKKIADSFRKSLHYVLQVPCFCYEEKKLSQDDITDKPAVWFEFQLNIAELVCIVEANGKWRAYLC